MHGYLALETYCKVGRVCRSQEVWWDKGCILGFCVSTGKIIMKLHVVFHVPEIRLQVALQR